MRASSEKKKASKEEVYLFQGIDLSVQFFDGVCFGAENLR